MMRRTSASPLLRSLLLSAVVALVLPARLQAQESNPPSDPLFKPPASPAVEDADSQEAPQSLEDFGDRLESLEKQIKQSKTLEVRPGHSLTIGGYLDLGFFWPVGNNGAGTREDYGNAAFPQYRGKYGWVFTGDLLSQSVNSRGDQANLGNLPGVIRYDPINTGAPSFIANELNLKIGAGLAKNVLLSASVNFVPRSGSNFAYGDFVDIDLAQVEWLPFASGNTSIFVGKMRSVLGLEYRTQKADEMFGISPTYSARYTTGDPIGLKVRTKLLDDHLVLALALTNGSSSWEQWFFYTETATHSGKTGSGRLGGKVPLLGGTFEAGVSGEAGPQDHALDNSGLLWLLGADAFYTNGTFTLKGAFFRGFSPGNALDNVYSLALRKTFYVEADAMVVPSFGFYARGELRDAFIALTDERAYLSKSWRAVGGLRASISESIILKAEYAHNGDYGGVPHFLHDMFTSSLILVY